MEVRPISRERLAEEIVGLVTARAGRIRVAVDGAPPTRPVELATQVGAQLPMRGRPMLIVAAGDFLRPASVRLEFGRTDPAAFLDGWLDLAALRREVLDPMAPHGSGRVLPRLWNAAADRSHRDAYLTLAADAVVLVAGSLLLGSGLPFDVAVHLRMSPDALARRLDDEERWTLPAYARYEEEHDPAGVADLLVLADHPERPAMIRK